MPLATYVRKYSNMKFEPAGITDDPELRIASSLVDYIFRRVALDYLSYEERAGARRPVDVRADPADVARRRGECHPSVGLVDDGPWIEPSVDGGDCTGRPSDPVMPAPPWPGPSSADAPFCYSCGNVMQRAGSCYVCGSCGSTSGCS